MKTLRQNSVRSIHSSKQMCQLEHNVPIAFVPRRMKNSALYVGLRLLAGTDDCLKDAIVRGTVQYSTCTGTGSSSSLILHLPKRQNQSKHHPIV